MIGRDPVAVNGNYGIGDVGSGRGHQEQGGTGDLLQLAGVAERGGGNQALGLSIVRLAVQSVERPFGTECER